MFRVDVKMQSTKPMSCQLLQLQYVEFVYLVQIVHSATKQTPSTYCSGNSWHKQTPSTYCSANSWHKQTPSTYCSGNSWHKQTPSTYCSGNSW
jgi:hypothetical protein